MRLIRPAVISAILFSLAACARGPGPDGVRTPLWVLGGEGIVHAQRHRPWIAPGRSERFDLRRIDVVTRDTERILKRVDPAGLNPRALAPDGRRLACVVGSGVRRDLEEVDLATGDRRVLVEGLPLRAGTAVWDPEGRRIAVSLAGEAAVAVLSPEAGTYERIPAGAPRVCDWLADGRLLLATELPAEGGNSLSAMILSPDRRVADLWHTPAPGGAIRGAAAAPHGRHIAVLTVMSDGRQSHLTLLDLETGEARTVWESPRPLTGLGWAPDGAAVFVSQLSRERGGAWTLHRFPIDTLRREEVADHRAGWSIAPDSDRLALSDGERIALRRLSAR